MEVREYIREDGSSPYQKWFDSLDAQAAARVTVAIARLEAGYRIYLARFGKQLIVLFGGGTKKKQQADINRAKELYQEYKRRIKES